MANVKLLINNTNSDTPVANIGTDWIEVDPVLDYFIFSQGGGAVADGEEIPTNDILNRYAVQLDADNIVIVPKYFLADVSEDKLKEIKLAGNQNKRYVFAVSFDGATATEPILECWDSPSMSSIDSPALGEGTPNLSWYLGVCTTDALPGEDWVGVPLAGDGVFNTLLLNNGAGALTEAEELYFNLKIAIPAGYTTPGLHTPVMVIIYATN